MIEAKQRFKVSKAILLSKEKGGKDMKLKGSSWLDKHTYLVGWLIATPILSFPLYGYFFMGIWALDLIIPCVLIGGLIGLGFESLFESPPSGHWW